MRDWVILPKFKNLFNKGKAKNHLFGSKVLSFSVVALRLNFKQPPGHGGSFSRVFAPLTVAVVQNVTIVRVFGTQRNLLTLRL